MLRKRGSLPASVSGAAAAGDEAGQPAPVDGFGEEFRVGYDNVEPPDSGLPFSVFASRLMFFLGLAICLYHAVLAFRQRRTDGYRVVAGAEDQISFATMREKGPGEEGGDSAGLLT